MVKRVTKKVAAIVALLMIASLSVAGCTINTTSPSPTAVATVATPIPSPTNTIQPTPAPVLTAGSSFSCIHANPDRTSEGIVTKVTDGDTIHVLINNKDYTVRYIGINAPEDTTKKEWMGPEATARDKELVAGKKVILVKDVSETDRYGRLLRFVFVGSILVNYELVREGYAKATPYSPDISCKQIFYDAQQLAQQEQRGLWRVGSAS